MEKRYRIHVFGKPGCEKCALLNKRIDGLLQEEGWQEFEKIYHDVDTVEGLVAFAQAECLNPSRIPSFLIAEKDPDTGRWRYLPRLFRDDQIALLGRTVLYTYQGLETDYSSAGKGLIPPNLIEQTMQLALQRAAPPH